MSSGRSWITGSQRRTGQRRTGQRLTGERPIDGQTPSSLLGLHAAGYRELGSRVGAGVILDAGCGTGEQTTELMGTGRTVIALDYDRTAVRAARCRHSAAAGSQLATERGCGLHPVCGDGAALPLADASVDWACSSHLIEHFSSPARHVAELARVLRCNGTALLLTPNAPWDFENPFHVALFRPADLASLLSSFFEEVVILGLEGSARAQADFAARRERAARALAVADPFDLRHRLPRVLWRTVYAAGLPLAYRTLGRPLTATVAHEITAEDFYLAETVVATTPVLFASASRPRRLERRWRVG